MIDSNIEGKAKALAKVIQDGKGADVVLLDISALNSTADCFIIATTASHVHCQGLRRQAEEYAHEAGLSLHEVKRRTPDGDEWSLVDLGSIIVHLMSKDARAFYDLETLWQAGRKVDFSASI